MRITRILLPFAAALAATAVAVPAASAETRHPNRSATASTPQAGFASSASGALVVSVDGAIRVAASAPTSVSCTTARGLRRSNSVASVNLPGIGQTGVITTGVTTDGSASSSTTTATSTIAGINLLGGLVKADAVTVKSTAKSTNGVLSTSGEAELLGLTIADKQISAKVAPNTKISLSLAGERVGTVALNVQSARTAYGVTTAVGRGIYITILAGNPLGLPASTTIQIGGVQAGISLPRVAIASGSGFGVTATALDGAVKVAPLPRVSPPCLGGVSKASVVSVNVPGLVTAGLTDASAQSNSSLTTATVAVRSQTAGLSVLGGLITADTVTADVRVSRSATGVVGMADTSKFVNLRVVGLPIVTSNPRPNTSYNVLGLGQVTFHKQVRTTTGIRVVMLEIKLANAIAGLPTGTVVEIAGAHGILRS